MSERTIQPCAAKGCRHSAVGSVLVTRDPGRLPYSLWVCEGHRSLLMKAEAERKAQKPATVAPKFSADSPCPGSGRMWTPRRSDALPHAPAIPAGAPPAPEEPMPKAPPTIKATINPDLCKIEGCDRPRHARGLCSPHWATGKNHGWLDQIGDPKKAPGPQKLPRPAPAGAEKALAEISRIQRERAAPTLAEAAALANKIAEAEIEFVPPADKAELATVNKKPVDLGDVPGWPAITPELSDDEAQQSRLTGELADAWDRTWTFESDGDRPCRWISRNKLNNQVSLIVWWDDAWIWRAVDGDRVLAFGSGDSAAEIAGQYKEWNKGGTIVDNDWNGAAETGTGDSDSLISGVVGIDSGEPTVPAAVAATMAEAQLAEAGRLAVQVEGLQADLDMAKTEINHLEKDLKRTQDGWDKSDAAREEMETQLETARARIAELQHQLTAVTTARDEQAKSAENLHLRLRGREAQLLELTGVRDSLKQHRDHLMIQVATITLCHQRRCSELEAAQWMLAALGIKADSVVAGIQQLAQLPTNVLARRWAAWSQAQELMGQAETLLKAARGEVDDA